MNVSDDTLLYSLELAKIKGVSSILPRKLTETYSSTEALVRHTHNVLTATPLISSQLA